jgi:N-acetylglucosamine kinase-like BadF-type ATPase
MRYFLGIDGGGSTLRAALVDESLTVVAAAERGTANPNVIGFDAAAELIQSALRETSSAGAEPVSAVGIGIAGASLAFDWMRETVAAALPGVPVFPALDVEIALVGAHGARRGALILAGTGSIVYGINAAGETAQAGGWGYLLSDEGGGYWLGLQALRAVTLWADGIDDGCEPLARRVMDMLRLTTPREVIAWVYRQPIPVKEIAGLAPLVLTLADEGDAAAYRWVESAIWHLEELAIIVRRRLQDHTLPTACAGGLLTTENALSRGLRQRTGLITTPQPKYPPVIGAALLAKIMLEKE